MTYAFLEGLLLGDLSAVVDMRLPGVAVGLFWQPSWSQVPPWLCFANGKLRATPKLNKIFMIGAIGSMAYGFISILGAGIFGSRTGGTASSCGLPLGLIVGLFAVALATYSLLLDFTTTSGLWAGLPSVVLASCFRPDRFSSGCTLRFCVFSCTWQTSLPTTKLTLRRRYRDGAAAFPLYFPDVSRRRGGHNTITMYRLAGVARLPAGRFHR